MAALFIVAGIGVFMRSPDEVSGDNFSGLSANDLTVVATGQAIYAEHCAQCHGVNLEGQPNWRQRLDTGRLPAPPHDETGHTWHHPDAYLFLMTKYGLEHILGEQYPNDMPVYKDVLSDHEISAVLSYIKSRWPKPIQRQHDQLNERANIEG